MPVPTVLSVNVGVVGPTAYSDVRVTGIDKRPVTDSVMVREPGPRGVGGSGVIGDPICDLRHHGGTDQAVYAYAREDLDFWERELERPLRCGAFGENLTTRDLDLTDALVGERWQVGDECVLEVTSPRIPCRTFAGWLAEQRWVRRFTEQQRPGAYLRVISPGRVGPGDTIRVLGRPNHHITIGFMFRAMTTEKVLLPQLAVAGDALPARLRRELADAPSAP
ncbi:MAG: MOSC domain-containing protein [Candidatus Dormibacteraeota bacterium]|nr:MOSC domain-containing protein [Candidatus Dormibacteraeota bacterium]